MDNSSCLCQLIKLSQIVILSKLYSQGQFEILKCKVYLVKNCVSLYFLNILYCTSIIALSSFEVNALRIVFDVG